MRKYIILFGLAIVCFSNNLYAQIGGKESFSITYNVYRTWTEGEIPNQFNNLKWQVRFLTTSNSIEQYWERDGFPATKFELWKTFEVIESKKVDTYVYSYRTKNSLLFFYNSESPSSIVIQDGKKYTEYAYYDSYYNKFK